MNSSDQGQLAELSYRREFDLGPDVASQVGIAVGDQRRVFDFVDPATGQTVEVKSGANAPTASDLEQLDAMMTPVARRRPTPVGDSPVRLGRQRLVLLDPQAASNRFRDLLDLLENPDYQGRLDIQIAGPDGDSWLLRQSTSRHLEGRLGSMPLS